MTAPALAAAWGLTHDQRYARHFVKHLRAWFVEPTTKMNPNLDYAQVIFGVTKGRCTGIIDTLHLVEVVRAVRVLEATAGSRAADVDEVRAWFAAYLYWMTTSKMVGRRRQRSLPVSVYCGTIPSGPTART